jgi:hypothetical protein
MGEKTTKAMKGAALALLMTLTGCAGLGAKKKPVAARCNEQPQWTTTDERGYPIGIYVCFGEENQLLYAIRVLPPPAPAAAPAPKTKASPKASVKPPTPAATKLPAVSGTAK